MSFWNMSPVSAQAIFRGMEAYYNIMSWPYGYSVNFLGDTYYGNFDYNSTDYNTAVQQNILLHNPFYVPYIPVNIDNGINDVDASQVRMAADKTILQCKFISLGTNLNNLLAQIKAAMTSKDLTDGQKAELENLKSQAEDLLKRREEFAEKSPDMDIYDAVAQMETLYGEYYDLDDKFNNLANRIRSGEDVTPPQAQKTPEEIAHEYENTTKPAIEALLENSGVSDEAKQALRDLQERLEKAIQDGAPQEELNEIYDELQNKINEIQSNLPQEQVEQDDEDETPIEEMSVADIKGKLDNEIKSAIRDLQNDKYLDENPDISDLKAKQLELRNAIRNGASEDEIRALYKELKDMITVAKVKSEIGKTVDPELDGSYLPDEDKEALKNKYEALEEAQTQGRDEDFKNLLVEIAEMIEDAKEEIEFNKAKSDAEYAKGKKECDELYKQLEDMMKKSKIAEGNALSEYISEKDKKELEDLIAEYQQAVKDKKPIETLKGIIENIKNKVNTLETNAQTVHDAAYNIVDKIYKSAMGPDFGGIFGTSTREQAIEEAVNDINENNILAVLKIWDKSAYNETKPDGGRDICILYTINDEFRGARAKQKKFTEHILNALEGYAKNNGLEDEIRPYLIAIRGLFESSKEQAYKKFQEMLKNVFNIPPRE